MLSAIQVGESGKEGQGKREFFNPSVYLTILYCTQIHFIIRFKNPVTGEVEVRRGHDRGVHDCVGVGVHDCVGVGGCMIVWGWGGA